MEICLHLLIFVMGACVGRLLFVPKTGWRVKTKKGMTDIKTPTKWWIVLLILCILSLIGLIGVLLAGT